MLKKLVSSAALVFMLIVGFQVPAQAQELVISGSSTVGRGLLVPREAEIERRSGVQLDIQVTGSGHGVRALFNGSADMAMISAPLGAVLSNLNAQDPGSINGRELVAHQVGSNQVAFIVHPSNPVKFLTSQQLLDILTGKITNWSEVGGIAMPIQLLAEPQGGGVRGAVEYQLRERGDVLVVEQYVQSSQMVTHAIAQVPGGLGITAYAHVSGSVALVTTEETIEQPYILITRGQPLERARSVIEAARSASGWFQPAGAS